MGKKTKQQNKAAPCMCILQREERGFHFSAHYRSNLKNPVPVFFSYALISQSVITLPRSSSRLSSPTVSFSAGLLAWCVCHVQRQQVCDEEAPSSGILNFSHSNKGWCCQKVLWLLGFCVNRSFVGYCYEEAIKQWPHHSLTGYTVWGKSQVSSKARASEQVCDTDKFSFIVFIVV